MKSPLYLCLLALGLSACADTTPSLRLLSARGFDATCGVNGADVYVTDGAIDLAQRSYPGLASNLKLFPMPFSVESNFGEGAVPLDVNGQPVSGSEVFDIFIERVELRYRGELTAASQSVPTYAVYRGNTDPDESYITINLLTPESFLELADQAGPDPVVVNVGVKLVGTTTGGSEVESNEVFFPLTVTSTTPAAACPTGTVPNITFCGGGGYNGVPLVCGAPGP